MKKFDLWTIDKKRIDQDNDYQPLYHERQVRWCRLGINIGFEQDGTGEDYSRPVLILKGFSRQVCVVLPLTTSAKENKYLLPIGLIGERHAQVILSQIRLIDTKRLDRHIATIDKVEFEGIRKAVKNLL